MKMIYYGYILLGLLAVLIPITYYIFQRIIYITISIIPSLKHKN